MPSDEFRTLALAELPAVFRLAAHLARDRHEAEDAAQETFLRAFRSEATYRPGVHGIRPWLFKILHNVLSSRLSKAEADRNAAAEWTPPPLPAEAGPGRPAGDCFARADALDWDRVDERLKGAVQDLSLTLRTAFLLCAVEGMGYREIAGVLDVPIGTVMSRLFRARAFLASRLNDLAEERGYDRAQGSARPPTDGMERPA